MKYLPLIWTTLIICIGIAGILTVLCHKGLTLTDNEKVTSVISILACVGGLISAVFVVHGYLQSIEIQRNSQKPQLLIWVETLGARNDQGETVPMTKINYRNITMNMFEDLNVSLEIGTENRKIEIEGLFRSDMQMIGGDTRQRTFNTFDEIERRGFDLNGEIEAGNTVSFTIRYNFTFNKRKESVLAQKYKWNPSRQEWEIL